MGMDSTERHRLRPQRPGDKLPDFAKSVLAIYRHGDRLFLHAVAPTEADWDLSRRHPALEKWHTYMATLMVTDELGQTIVEDLPEAFSFGIFRP